MQTLLEPETQSLAWFHRRNHGKRTIFEPNDAMRVIHRQLIDHLQQLSFDFSSAHGGLPGKSIVTNATAHRKGKYFYILDIANAYENVDLDSLADVLDKNGVSISGYDTAAFLHRFCAGDEGLAVGAPASPLLFNIYCAEAVDLSIRALLDTETTYTRYLDDITISSDRPLPRVLRRRIRNVLSAAGFSISRHKARLLQVAKGPIPLPGAQIHNGELEPSEDFMERVCAELHRHVPEAKRIAHAQRLHGYANFIHMFGHSSPRARILEYRCRNKARTIMYLEKKPLPTFVPGGKITRKMIRVLKTQIPVTSVVESYLGPGKKRGHNVFWRSPFKKEKTASFSTSLIKEFYHCFASGEHGDVIEFVMKMEHVDFAKAFALLNDRFGVFKRPL